MLEKGSIVMQFQFNDKKGQSIIIDFDIDMDGQNEKFIINHIYNCATDTFIDNPQDERFISWLKVHWTHLQSLQKFFTPT